MKDTYFVRGSLHFGRGNTVDEAMTAYRKQGGTIKELVSKERAVTRVTHMETVNPFVDTFTSTLDLNGGSDSDRRRTLYAYATVLRPDGTLEKFNALPRGQQVK